MSVLFFSHSCPFNTAGIQPSINRTLIFLPSCRLSNPLFDPCQKRWGNFTLLLIMPAQVFIHVTPGIAFWASEGTVEAERKAGKLCALLTDVLLETRPRLYPYCLSEYWFPGQLWYQYKLTAGNYCRVYGQLHLSSHDLSKHVGNVMILAQRLVPKWWNLSEMCFPSKVCIQATCLQYVNSLPCFTGAFWLLSTLLFSTLGFTLVWDSHSFQEYSALSSTVASSK